MRNLFIIITVALSAALIFGLAGFSAAYDKAEERGLATQPQVVYRDIDKEQIECLRNDERIEDMVLYKNGSAVKIGHYTVRPCYAAEDGATITNIWPVITKGRYPEAADEAAVPEAYLEIIGAEPVIGGTCSVTWLDGRTEAFTVTGLTGTVSRDSFGILLSEEYAENGRELKEIRYTAAVRIVGADDMDDRTFLEEIRGIGGEYGIPRYKIRENSRFVLRISQSTTSEMVATLVISMSVLFVSVFVIYNIFYISVTGRIRQFG